MASRHSFSTIPEPAAPVRLQFSGTCLILHAFDKMARAANKAALLKGGLPAGNRALDHAMTALLLPFAHLADGNSPPSVTACTHSRWLPARRCMLVVTCSRGELN